MDFYNPLDIMYTKREKKLSNNFFTVFLSNPLQIYPIPSINQRGPKKIKH